MSKLQIMFALLLFAWLASQPLLPMSDEEKAATGVSKLSEQEQSALQRWIDTHYTKRIASSVKKTSAPILQESLNNGRYVGLSDGTSWEIHPSDRAITQSWITPVAIEVSSSKNSDYPYLLKNSLTGSSVRARKAPTS